MSRLLLAGCLLLCFASTAGAATTTTPTTPTVPLPPPPVVPKLTLTAVQAKLLWATVNICDTRLSPDTVGIAVSMPYLKKAKDMYVRFRLQYLDAATKTFKPVPDVGADSYWEPADPGKGKVRVAGHEFELTKPQGNIGYVVRAEVSFEWRKAGKVMLRAKRLTTAKHPGTLAADPKRFSAANCTIRP